MHNMFSALELTSDLLLYAMRLLYPNDKLPHIAPSKASLPPRATCSLLSTQYFYHLSHSPTVGTVALTICIFQF